jgi:hypothetical protein
MIITASKRLIKNKIKKKNKNRIEVELQNLINN